jgi:hypothetical protein
MDLISTVTLFVPLVLRTSSCIDMNFDAFIAGFAYGLTTVAGTPTLFISHSSFSSVVK